MELVVFVASLKFFFVEGGEQFIVGAQTAKKIGIRSTLTITIAGISYHMPIKRCSSTSSDSMYGLEPLARSFRGFVFELCTLKLQHVAHLDR
jgi:hypothetical protein